MSVISIGQKTIINVLDGSTIEAQYAKNTSPTTPPATGWGPSIPPPEIGYYVWKQERMANPDGTFEPWQSPIRITGDQGQKGDSGTSAIIEYSVGPSNINHPKIPEPIGYAGKGIGYLGKVIGYGFSWDTIAPEVPIGSFLWQRQRVGLLSKWSYSCLTGIQGPPGIPGKLGLSAVGSTLYLKGFNADGSFGATTGLINFGDEQLTIPEAEYTFDEEGPGYIILDTTLSTIVPKFVKMVAVASTSSYISWRDFNTGTEIAVSSNTNFIVIGTFQAEFGLIVASEIINPALLNTFTKSHFMDLLNDRQTVTSGNFALWADAMGVTDVFASLAAYELFVDNLTSNEGFIENLGATNIKINEGGSIYSGYSADGITPPLSGAGFWLGSNGKLKAYFAELLGTLRTGLNAPTDARVAVQDESGIIAGPTYYPNGASGLNDLSIVSQGSIASKVRVKIESLNVEEVISNTYAYSVGETGPAGGKIFLISNGIAYECSPSSTQVERVYWSSSRILCGTSTSVGSGRNNTDLIIANHGSDNNAAKRCKDLVYGGFSDWYLPSLDELMQMYIQRDMIGGFDRYDHYWSSSEKDTLDAWCIYFYNGEVERASKPVQNNWWMRAIRSFPSTYQYNTYKYRDSFKVGFKNGDNITYGNEILIPDSKTYTIPNKEITIRFGSQTGHKSGEYWEFEQGSMRGLVITDTAGNEYFSASNGVVNVKKTLLLSGIPTSATGLPSGSVWRDGATLKIV